MAFPSKTIKRRTLDWFSVPGVKARILTRSERLTVANLPNGNEIHNHSRKMLPHSAQSFTNGAFFGVAVNLENGFRPHSGAITALGVSENAYLMCFPFRHTIPFN